MKKVLGYILFGLAVAAFIAGTSFLVIRGKGLRHEIACSEVQIHFQDTLRFIDQDYALGFLTGHSDPYIGMRIEDIDLSAIESRFLTQSCIRECQAWVTDDGVLHIELTHRIPALLFRSGESVFYADIDGTVFTSPCDYIADVPVVLGNVREAFNTQWIADMLSLVGGINKSAACRGRVLSYSVDDIGELELVLRDGTVAMVGNPRGHASTLRDLEYFFTTIQAAKGPGYYKTINTKYKGQIVCRKES